MRRKEKRRKFHESLLNTLYPPESQPQSKSDDDQTRTSTTTFDVNLIPDDYGLSSASTSDNDDDGEGESEKLTRAQRKRRRKKKLKEDNSRRKQLIGPLKPLTSNESDGGSAREKCTPPVRQNADENCGQSKVKQRRTAKKLVKERLKPSDIKDSLQEQSCELINGENSDDDRKLRTIDDGQTCEEDQSYA